MMEEIAKLYADAREIGVDEFDDEAELAFFAALLGEEEE